MRIFLNERHSNNLILDIIEMLSLGLVEYSTEKYLNKHQKLCLDSCA